VGTCAQAGRPEGPDGFGIYTRYYEEKFERYFTLAKLAEKGRTNINFAQAAPILDAGLGIYNDRKLLSSS